MWCNKYLTERSNSKLLNSKILMAHPNHQQMIYLAMKGGIKSNSEETYIKKYAHFIKIILGLGHNPFAIPIEIDLILLYLANDLLKNKSNVYGTVRLKMRALDWVNQQIGHHSSWSKDGFIKPVMQHIKKYHPSKGSNLMPLVLKDIITLIEWLTEQYNNLNLSKTKRFEWYLFMIYSIISYTCALRVSEAVHPADSNDNSYGLRFCDFKFGYMVHGKIAYGAHDIIRRSEVHCIEITLQNSKTRKPDEIDILYIGPTPLDKKYNPLLLIFDCFAVYNNMAAQFPGTYSFKVDSKLHFFQNETERGYFYPDWCLKKVKHCFKKIGYPNIDQIGTHSFRKGFNTWLSSLGVNDASIATAGRWYLWAAFHRYSIFHHTDMIGLTELLWTPAQVQLRVVDYDYCLHLFHHSTK